MLKTETWSVASRLFSADFQSKMSIALLIWSEFTCLKNHTILSYGDAYIIWWWQWECKETRTPESIPIFGWDINIKSMQDFEFSSICVGSLIICKILGWEVIKSSFERSKLVILFSHQCLDLAPESPVMTVRNGLTQYNSSEFNFRCDLTLVLNVRNSSCVWPGDL